MKTVEDRFWEKVGTADSRGCRNWLASTWGGHEGDRYGQFRIKGKGHYAHRFSYRLTVGEIPKGMIVMHTCDNRLCCAPEHLKLGTHLDNSADMVRKGRQGKHIHVGEENPNCKLSDKQVVTIRKLYEKGGISYRLIAKLFGVSKQQIGNILRGEARVLG